MGETKGCGRAEFIAVGSLAVQGVAEGGAGCWDVSMLIWWLSCKTLELIAWSEPIIPWSI